jgi:hypothetical protein
MTGMAVLATRIGQLILQQLKGGEKGILALVVSVRSALSDSESVKGDLSEQVKSAVRKLVESKQVTVLDGWYSLNLSK